MQQYDYSPLYPVIRSGESSNMGDKGYDMIHGGTPEGVNISELPIRDAMKIADGNAMGAFQIVPENMKYLFDNGVVTENDIYNKETQDRLASYLLGEKRGLNKLLSEGKYTEAALVMSKEWGAIGVPYDMKKTVRTEKKWDIPKNATYYVDVLNEKGKQINKASITSEEIIASLKSISGN